MLEKIILGTYTKRESQGIYEITLDSSNGKLTNLTHTITATNPTFVGRAINNCLYTVGTIEGKGGMLAYKPTEDMHYDLLNAVTDDGASPCYVGIDNDRQLVFGANYHKGQVTSYKINSDGSITLADTVQHIGQGPHENQTSAHAHYADLTPDKRLVACDLGTDTVYTYDVTLDGKLTEIATFKATPGTGPRHLVFHPTNQVAYLFGELANTVTVLSYDVQTGTFTEKQTLSTLPTDFKGFSGGAAIRISNDGRFVYVSNRGHNSIAVFETKNEGNTLELIQLISSEGDFPRDFDLNKTEEFLIVSHQNSDNLTVFTRNAKTGCLELKEKDIYAPECVCTYFVN
ncbi:lactonase family protein [Vagococcus intermedius]|uniref:Lactonase family protein n=1 Tax=Vagococcus intermedius TaxID=2991418 RepID=A0AAF0CTX0_9ENTE|nr:lactonase family protein [Vagococcus intermedius]WEG72888.1 lactonase family protein [Vagococcus intermedius]WEG74975.1 lactonase family protein [Vagococcus intermedius]